MIAQNKIVNLNNVFTKSWTRVR